MTPPGRQGGASRGGRAAGEPTGSGGSEFALLREGLALTRRALRDAPFGFTIGGLGAALYAGAVVGSAVVLGRITDRVLIPAFRDGQTDGLWLAAAVILGVAAVKATGIFARRYGAYRARFRLEADYRHRVVGRYLSLPLAWHRRHSTGELLSNANDDVTASWFIAAPLPMAFGATLLLVAATVMLVVTDPYLAAVGAVIGPAVGAANYYYQRRQRSAATRAQQGRAEVSEVAHESFDAALTVKALGREAAETHRFREPAERLRDRVIEVVHLKALFNPLVEALPKLGILAVLLVGAWRVQAGLMTAGDMVQFGFLFQLLALPMRVFGWLLGDLPRALAGWERIASVLDAEAGMAYGTLPGGPLEDGDAEQADEASRGAGVRLEDVAYRHPATTREDLSGRPPGSAPVAAASGSGRGAGDPGPARDGAGATHGEAVGPGRGVSDVDLDIAAGATVAVVGSTGAGKSTLAALLVRLFDPDTGRITYDGSPLPALDRDALTANVAIAFQDPFLFADTVRANITLEDPVDGAAEPGGRPARPPGRRFDHEDVVRAARTARAHGFVTRLENGYDTPVGERGATLSGGQRQRVALARALIRRPRLLVLDDATSAVDPVVETEILERLAETDTTVVNVAYRQSSIALADEVVFVRGGTVAAHGTHEELMASEPAYAELLAAYSNRGLQAAERAGADAAPGGSR